MNSVIALILLYFTEFYSVAGLNIFTALHARQWLKINLYCLVVSVCRISSSTFGQNWPPPLQHDLSAIGELLVNFQPLKLLLITPILLLVSCTFTQR